MSRLELACGRAPRRQDSPQRGAVPLAGHAGWSGKETPGQRLPPQEAWSDRARGHGRT